MQGGIAAEPAQSGSQDDLDSLEEYGWRNWGDTPARNEVRRDRRTATQAAALQPAISTTSTTTATGCCFHGASYNLDGKPGGGSHPVVAPGRTSPVARSGYRHLSLHHQRHHRPAALFNGGKVRATPGHGVDVVNASHRGSPRPHLVGHPATGRWGRGQSPEERAFSTTAARWRSITLRATVPCWKVRSKQCRPGIFQGHRTMCSRRSTFTSRGHAGNNLQVLTDAYLLYLGREIRDRCGGENSWTSTGSGQAVVHERIRTQAAESGQRDVGAYLAAHAICINAVGRWTDVMEEKTGKPYAPRAGNTWSSMRIFGGSGTWPAGPKVGIYGEVGNPTARNEAATWDRGPIAP